LKDKKCRRKDYKRNQVHLDGSSLMSALGTRRKYIFLDSHNAERDISDELGSDK
jgi:hypothetical protein